MCYRVNVNMMLYETLAKYTERGQPRIRDRKMSWHTYPSKISYHVERNQVAISFSMLHWPTVAERPVAQTTGDAGDIFICMHTVEIRLSNHLQAVHTPSVH